MYRAGNSKKTTQTQLFMRYVYLIAVYVHFFYLIINLIFIDPTINSHTNLYNVASSRLL